MTTLSAARCPECGSSITLVHHVIPAHLPRQKGHQLCAASGWIWSSSIWELPWRAR
jgi:hypothetical protein